MAIVRTVLPRKGIIQPKHGDNYETDLDTNWELIDSLLQDAVDVQAAVLAAGTVEAWLQDRGLCGVISGFVLSTSADLTPGLSAGVLYAQGKRYAPATAPNPGPAPANSTSYLWHNASSGFYYNLTGSPGASGDAYLGSVTTDTTHVTAVTNATKIYSQLSAAPGTSGSFSLQHYLGRAPIGAVIQMTSGGAIWFQSPTMYDGTNLYLVASDAGVTAKVVIW
jgi:hypothetical protein